MSVIAARFPALPYDAVSNSQRDRKRRVRSAYENALVADQRTGLGSARRVDEASFNSRRSSARHDASLASLIVPRPIAAYTFFISGDRYPVLAVEHGGHVLFGDAFNELV